MSWWQQLVAWCGGVTVVLALAGAAFKGAERMWISSRRGARLVDQLLGDANAKPIPIPSLMDQVASTRAEVKQVRTEVADLAAGQAQQIRDAVSAAVAEQMSDHVRALHLPPNGNPAPARRQTRRR